MICSFRCIFSGIPGKWLPDKIVGAVSEESHFMMDTLESDTVHYSITDADEF